MLWWWWWGERNNSPTAAGPKKSRMQPYGIPPMLNARANEEMTHVKKMEGVRSVWREIWGEMQDIVQVGRV